MDRIAIWGAGDIGKRTYMSISDCYKVEAFYDNDCCKWGDKIDGIPILEYTKKEFLIVIATATWKEIAVSLKEMHLEIIKDFIPWWMLEERGVSFVKLLEELSSEEINEYFRQVRQKKKVVVIFGNCQTTILSKMVMFNPDFRREHLIIEIPRIYEYDNELLAEKIANSSELWLNVDLFIYQAVSKNNRFSEYMATDNLIKKLRDDCQKICITNMYFNGYFFQCTPINRPILPEINKAGLFLFQDYFVDEEIRKNGTKDIDNIIETVNGEGYIDSQIVLNKCNESLAELKKREEKVDVKICDWIENKYKEEQIFFSANHPTNALLFEYSNRILEYLGYSVNKELSETDLYLQFGTLKGEDMPVYPSVIKALNLKKYEKNYYPNRFANADYLLDFASYQREYIYFRWIKL